MKKKVLALVSAFCLMAMMTVPAMAADAYVSSVTGSDRLSVESAVDANGGNVEIVITPYSEKATLSEEAAALMDEAYKKLASEGVNISLPDGVSKDSLRTVSFVDIAVKGEATFPITITLKADYGNSSFVQMIHYENGAWVAVDTKAADGKVTFTVDSLSPFALVTSTTSADSGEETGNETGNETGATTADYFGFMLPAIAICCVAGGVYCVARAKKHS